MAKGQLDKAIVAYRQAIGLKKNFPEAHCSLGNALMAKGQLDEAIAEFRQGIQLKKDDPYLHYNLGRSLRWKGQLEDAIAEYREAIQLKKDYPEAHCNLGDALVQKGQFRLAVQEIRLGHELGSRNPSWPHPSAQWLRNAERLAQLDMRLPKILKGEDRPADAAERVQLGWLCQQQYKQLNAAAARFYAEAFAAEPKLADDDSANHRYNAACAAALASSGQGKDADKLDEKERARLRQQTLAWLRADLAAWRKILDKEPVKARPFVRQSMQHWQQDTDLAGVRGDALAKLPETERQDWRKLWQEVEELGKRAADSKRQ